MNYHKFPVQHMTRTMSVIGNGEISVQPNIVQVQLEVVTENEHVNQAQQENSMKMNQVIEGLLQLGILRENIQTTSFQVQPIYDYVDGKQQFRGYQVLNSITVQINEIDQVGHVIDIAIQNGANQILNLQFSLSNEQTYEQIALQKALKDATLKAQTIASQMHVSLDPIPIKIEEELVDQFTPYLKTSLAEFSSTTPIEVGLIQIKAKLHVDFRY